MSNQSGNQNNPQLAGSNIVGVNPGDALQKDAQALQRASAGAFGATSGVTSAGMGATSNAAYGATNALGLGATSMAGSSGAQSNTPQLAGANIVGVNAGDARQKDAAALQRAAGGLGAATSMGGFGGATNAAFGAGATSGMGGMGAATSMAGGSGSVSTNNPQLAGANIVGVNSGDALQKDAAAMQRLGQSGGTPLA